MSRSPDAATRAALERLLDLAGEQEARQILADVAGPSTRSAFERLVVRRLALRLLQLRNPRTVIRDRLLSRGISQATAYRLIDAALREGARVVSLTNELAVRDPDPRLPDPQQLEQPLMQPTNIAGRRARVIARLTEERNALRDKVGAADDWKRRTEAAHQAATHAKDASSAGWRTASDAAQHKGGLSLEEKAVLSQAFEAAGREENNARYDMHRATVAARELNPLRPRLAELSALLGSESAMVRCVETARGTRDIAATTAAALRRAQDALATLKQLLATEEAAHAAARGDAAAQLLAAVKAGGDASDVQAANRDKIATLELAKASAEQELAAAQATHSAATSKHAEAIAELKTARQWVDALNSLVAQDVAATAAAHARAEALVELRTPETTAAAELLA